MLEFYMIVAREIIKMPNLYNICLKINKIPEFS